MEHCIKQGFLPYNIPWVEQTELVTALLAINTWAGEDQRHEIYQLDEIREFNEWAYEVELPEGRFILAEQPFYTLVTECDRKYQEKAKEISTMAPADTDVLMNLNYKDLSVLMEALDGAQHFKRTVYSWWAIPHWLAQKLIEKNEVIILAYSNSWWGITDQSTLRPETTDVLKIICEEIQPIKPLSKIPDDRYDVT